MSLGARSLLAVLILVALALGNLELSSCLLVVQGKVTCLDCKKGHDLSGIRVLVKCDEVKKLSVGSTSRAGFFQTDLPKDSNVPQSPDRTTNCFVRVLGAPTQIYASEKNMVSKVVKAYHKTSLIYMAATPLAVSTTSPSSGHVNFGSSKTIDLPVPPEWGLARPATTSLSSPSSAPPDHTYRGRLRSSKTGTVESEYPKKYGMCGILYKVWLVDMKDQTIILYR